MNTRNSTNVVWIDTSMHRCTAMEEDVRYPIEDLRQGRDAQNRVPRVSPMAGKPRRTEEDNALRAGFWSFYAAVLLTAACVVILANWPN